MHNRKVAQFIPPEHGAWALLLVPYLVGTFAGDPSGWSLVLLVAWLAAYLSSYYAIHWWKSRHLRHGGRRFRPPALTYGAVLAMTGVALVWWRPWLLGAALMFVPFEAVAATLALRGNERSWVAGVSSATAAGLMAPLAYWVASGDQLGVAAELLTVAWLALVGSVLHVKSTIRERNNVRARWASIAFHAAALLIVVTIDPLYAVPFGFLLARAVAVPQRGWRPGRIGAVEIIGSVLVVTVTLLAT